MIINFDHPDAITGGSSRKINVSSFLIRNLSADVANAISREKIETSMNLDRALSINCISKLSKLMTEATNAKVNHLNYDLFICNLLI